MEKDCRYNKNGISQEDARKYVEERRTKSPVKGKTVVGP
jgi:hypothetical protein